MSLDQLLVKLSQAWRVQRQQIQVIAGALAFLVCIVCWERSQWTQPTRPDLLHDLLPSQPAYFPDLATDKLGQGASQHSDVSAWSCEESASWFHHQEHRWPELEEITNRLCQLEHHAADDATLSDATRQGADSQKHMHTSQLIERLQGKLARAALDLSETQQTVRLLCEYGAAVNPSTVAACEKLAVAQTKGVNFTESVRHLLEAEEMPASRLGSLQQYREAHPKKAVLGLNGIMSCPRLTTFILWLTGHNFRMANVKQAILVQAATAPYYAHAGLQILRCPFFGILLAVCMPGLQTALYAVAFMDQQPYMAVWVGLMGVLKVAVESYAMQMFMTHPMPLSEKLSSLICSHFLLPIINFNVGFLYVLVRPFLPAAAGNTLYLLFITIMPAFTVWTNAAVWSPRWDNAAEQAGRIAVAPEGRRGRNAFAAAWNAIEGRAAPNDHRPHVREAAAIVAPAGQDANATGHRHRDHHRHKEVHWPPPLLVPEHLEDSAEVPDSFKCPITFAIMKEPATTRNGLTYDRPAIMKWIEQHRRDPTTSLKLKPHHLSPNLSLRTVIQTWVDMQS